MENTDTHAVMAGTGASRGGPREGDTTPGWLRPGDRALWVMHNASDFQAEMFQWTLARSTRGCGLWSSDPLSLEVGGLHHALQALPVTPLSCSHPSLTRPLEQSAQLVGGRGFLGKTNVFLNPQAGSRPRMF